MQFRLFTLILLALPLAINAGCVDGEEIQSISGHNFVCNSSEFNVPESYRDEYGITRFVGLDENDKLIPMNFKEAFEYCKSRGTRLVNSSQDLRNLFRVVGDGDDCNYRTGRGYCPYFYNKGKLQEIYTGFIRGTERPGPYPTFFTSLGIFKDVWVFYGKNPYIGSVATDPRNKKFAFCIHEMN